MDAKIPHPTQDWIIQGQQDRQTVDENWESLDLPLIHGVATKEIRPVVACDGCLTEIWRHEWGLDDLAVGQVFQRLMDAGSVSGWHSHARTTDRIFCSVGRVRLSLYDGRKSSPTSGAVWQHIFGEHRPLLVVVPPGVWHGVNVLGSKSALVLNLVDRAYSYKDPDHWRLPPDTSHIPIKIV